MRVRANPELSARTQIQAIDALIEAGALSRARRRGSSLPRQGRAELGIAAPESRETPEVCVAGNGVEWVQARQLREITWLWHGFSTRRGGVSRVHGTNGGKATLNLGFTEEDTREAVLRNRELFAEAVTGDSSTPLISLKQFHSNLVVRAGLADAGVQPPRRADGLITGEPGVLLAVQTADCIPVLVADRERQVVGAFHAGWRGTVKRIVECGVGQMRLEFGSRPEDLVAAIGPGIGGCCYAVGEEVLAAFESQFAYARQLFHEVYDPDPVRTKYPMLFLNQRAPGHAEPCLSLHLDLVEANRRQLLDAGVRPERIESAGGCTNCGTERFFSYRAEQGHTGRMMAVIGIRDAKTR
ncbi:MAG TPA: peptidoglycan editing factor PgeF [Terracidiphilus sp.]